MSTCKACGQLVVVGYYHSTKTKDGTPRRETVLLDPYRQCFAAYYDEDGDGKDGARVFWSNARAEHVCRPAKQTRADMSEVQPEEPSHV